MRTIAGKKKMETDGALTMKPSPAPYRLLLAPILLLCLALLVLAACERERETVPAATTSPEAAAAAPLGEAWPAPAGELARSSSREPAPPPARTA
jgi:hypothetical protein